MGEWNQFTAKGADRAVSLHRQDAQLHLLGQAFFFQLAPDQTRGERRCIKRHAKVCGQIGDGADMVFMAMGQQYAKQIGFAGFNKFKIRQDNLYPRIFIAAEGDAKIDHQPFSLAAIEINIHANLIRPA